LTALSFIFHLKFTFHLFLQSSRQLHSSDTIPIPFTVVDMVLREAISAVKKALPFGRASTTYLFVVR